MHVRFPAIALAITVAAAACGGATPAATGAPSAAASAAATPTQAAPAKVSIMVGGLSKQIYLPNKLTEALGYFKEQNLTVDLIDEPSGKDTTTEVVAGNVDMGSGSYDHTIDIAAQGKSIQMVALFLQEPGEFVMVSNKMADKVKSAKDWKGLNAGVTSIGSGTHTIMRALTIKAGLQVSDVNFVAASAGETFITAMQQGKIDIGITTQPTALQVVNRGVGKLLIDLSKVDTTRANLGGDYPFISLFAKTDYIQKNKDVVQRVVNAYVKTLKWIQTHSPEEIADKLPSDYWGSDKAAYIQALKDSMGMFSPDGKMPNGAPEFVLNILKQFNEGVQKNPNIDLKSTWTNDFVSNAR
ncbi:MAG TPA: ABC transporter substrate-binding protein [Candidatus Limnocylindria bacterium]|nr:ABC transporter substrate-binding protein [Candidatus Limnocylindria bacterium]